MGSAGLQGTIAVHTCQVSREAPPAASGTCRPRWQALLRVCFIRVECMWGAFRYAYGKIGLLFSC